MKRFLREHTVLAIFSVAYMLAFAGVAVWTGNNEFVMYTVVVGLAAAAAVALDVTVARIPGWLLWCLSAWGLAHMLGGNLRLNGPEGERIVLYSLWLIPFNATSGVLRYDQVVHAFGFFTTACVCAVLLTPIVREERRTSPLLFAAGALASMGFGALNEVVEFIATLTLEHTNVGGYENTAWDLVSNGVGATLGGVLMWRLATRVRRTAS